MNTETNTFICPAEKRSDDDIVGCGLEFEAIPDHEGLVDCPHCGMWHKASSPQGGATEGSV